ncbi:MAG TPA: flagellar biosynthetic protein FliR [Acidobacteriaceae bacterium]|nr:flagellar biosynthetic protein FliR [Acidobacteriaceae bacterium]
MQAVIPIQTGFLTGQEIADWPSFLASGVLVMVRLSGLMVFAPIFSSAAIAPRIKAGFVIAMTILLAPVVGTLPHARVELDMVGLLGELAVGLTFGFALTLINETLMFAGQMLGMEFSFSLVNLLDPNSNIQTPVLGQLLGWVGILVLIGAGLDRSLLAAVMRSFAVVPVGQAVMHAGTGPALAAMTGGVLLAGLQLSAPVIAAALTVEVVVALVGRMSPQLPAMVVSIPLKTLISYAVLIGSLAVWPAWIERHFTALLDGAAKLVAG